MKKFLQKLNWKKILAGLLAVYLLFLAVNSGVLWLDTQSNNAHVDGLRTVVDDMSLGARLGSRILDADLNNHKAIGRVGDYYLSKARFDQLCVSQKHLQAALHVTQTDPKANFFVLDATRRMLIEQVVYSYAKEHHLSAPESEVDSRLVANVQSHGGVPQLQADLKKTYNWSLADFKAEIQYSVMKAKVEESLGGQKYSVLAAKGLQGTPTPKVNAYADAYAKAHINYLTSGGYKTLAKRFLSVKI